MMETQTTLKNHDEHIRELVSRLGSPLESERKKAMSDLSAIEDPKAVKILAGFISHKDNLVRYSVRRALNEIKKRHGDKFDIAGGSIASLTSAPGERTEEQSGSSFKFMFFVAFLILLQAGMTAYYFITLSPDVSTNAKKESFYSLAKLALPDPSKYNIVRFDKNCVAIIKIKGMVTNKNTINRQAAVSMNNSTAKCILSFREGIKMDFQAGEFVEAEGELIRNDNIGPVLMQCNKIDKVINKNRQ